VGESVEFNFVEFLWGTKPYRVSLTAESIPTSQNGLELDQEIPDSQQDASQMNYEIQEDHPECQSMTDGKMPVAIVDAESGEVECCHVSLEDAQAHVDALKDVQKEHLPDEVQAPPVAPEAPPEASRHNRLANLRQFLVNESGVAFAPLPTHKTPTTDTKDWDGDVVKVRTESERDLGYYGKIYAWRDSTKDIGHKTAYRFPHHIVNVAGIPGAAVDWATHASLMFIDDSGIPESDYEGVYRHLAAHLRDAGWEDIPDLGSDNASAEAVRLAISQIQVPQMTMQAPSGLHALEDSALVAEVVRRFIEAGETMTEMAEEEIEKILGVPEEIPDAEPVDSRSFHWEGIIIPEGVLSGDGRMIEQGALTWRDLPLPLMLQTRTAEGHDGAEICGSIVELERTGNAIVGRGYFDGGLVGQEARRLYAEKTMRGVSADLDAIEVEIRDRSGDAVTPDQARPNAGLVQAFVKARIMGASLVPFPAFMEATISVLDFEDSYALVASGAQLEGEFVRVWTPDAQFVVLGDSEPLDRDALVASGAPAILEIPVAPPAEWFARQDMEEAVPFRVYPDGRCFGLVAKFGSCHMSFADQCIDVPRSFCDYRWFQNKSTLTAEGGLVATGPVFMNTVHPALRARAHDAFAHYAETGCAVADVTLWENQWGIVAAGALRPDVTPEQARRIRGSDISPDWRRIDGRMELVALLGVNMSGFIVDGLVASGAEYDPSPRAHVNLVTGELESLVAAGMLTRECGTCGDSELNPDVLLEIARTLADHSRLIQQLNTSTRNLRAEYVASRIARMSSGG